MNPARSLLAGLVLVTLSACATSPVTISSTAPEPADDLYTCAMQQLARMDYTVADTDRESGFIRARTKASGFGAEFFAGKAYHSAMTVSIFDEPDNDESAFRVTVGQISEDTWGWGQGAESMGKPSDQGRDEADALVERCAPITGDVRPLP